MITFTNKNNLPEPIFNALCSSDYDQDDAFISTTRLIDAPFLWWCDKNLDVEVDAIERFWALDGTSIHYILEKSGSKFITELRLHTEVLGKILSGKADIYDHRNKKIADYKRVMKSMLRFKSYKPEWVKQLNVLAFLFRSNGFQVNELSIYALIRDYTKADRYNPEYPPIPFSEVKIPLWSYEEQEAYVNQRMKLFIDILNNPKPEPCSEEERWTQQAKYAVKKPTAKQAFKLFDDAKQAYDFIINKPEYIVEKRKGKHMRCDEYCAYKSKCPLYKDVKYA